MGYTTEFKGVLKFKSEPTTKELASLNKLFRDEDLQLELAEDFSGIQWDGSEKCYDMPDKVNRVIESGFPLTSQLEAQGEERNDRWLLVIGDDGRAHKQEIKATGVQVACPHCSDVFSIESHRLECVTAGHSKFWEVLVVGNSVLTRWGKIGTKGQQPAEPDMFRDESDALAHAAELIKAKTTKNDPGERYVQIF